MISVIGDLVVDILVSREGAVNYATDTNGSIQLRAGGQGNHVAAWIARSGVDSRLIGRVGDDPFGTFLLEEAEKLGVSCAVTVDSNRQTGKIVILIDEETGERSMITDRGANLILSREYISGIEDSLLLYISGYSLFSEGTREAVEDAKEAALSQGIPIALDPSSTYYLKERKADFLRSLEGVTFLFPNYEEGVLLTGETEPEQIALKLREYVPNPILKLGANGCGFFLNQSYMRIPAPQAEVVDSTGAGDSFAGAFLAEYIKTGNIESGARHAVDIASKVVAQIGARPSR